MGSKWPVLQGVGVQNPDPRICGRIGELPRHVWSQECPRFPMQGWTNDSASLRLPSEAFPVEMLQFNLTCLKSNPNLKTTFPKCWTHPVLWKELECLSGKCYVLVAAIASSWKCSWCTGVHTAHGCCISLALQFVWRWATCWNYSWLSYFIP